MAGCKDCMRKYDLFKNGSLCAPKSGRYFESVNPSCGEPFACVADAGIEDIHEAISFARKAFDEGAWGRLSVKERGQYLVKIADLIRENAYELAELETLDTGKTAKQTTFIDVPTVADTFEFFGSKAEAWLEDEVNNISNWQVKSRTVREPVGVVGCIIPWNYPLIMFGWKTAPALIAGNTVVFKPSSLASVSIMRLAEIIQDVGLPEGVLNIIPSSDHDVAEELIKSRDVDMISFTGGTDTGRKLMQLASVNTKKLCLELGGKSPNIVFADCDINAAVGGTMAAIFMNQGQMCTAGSRLLLEDKIYDEFLGLLVERSRTLRIGDATSYETEFGPLISKRHRDNVLSAVEKGIEEGARLVCGGKLPKGEGINPNGFYFEPTIFADVKNSMTIAREEIFGPVLSVIKFSSEQEAVSIANDSEYGLAACIWSQDAEKAQRVAARLRCGTVWINTYGGFFNEAPFGGYKQSGFGRELGRDGLLEYTQAKHICRDASSNGMPLVSSWF